MKTRAITATVASPALHDAKRNLETFVTAAKAQQPYAGVVWDTAAWDISAADARARAHLRNKQSLLFTEHAETRVPIHRRTLFIAPFADLAKACIVTRRVNRGIESGPQRVFMRAARYLYAACPLPVRRDPTLLTREYFVRAETAAFQREKASSAYRVGRFLEDFARLVDRHGLARISIDYRSAIPRPQSVLDRTSSAFEERIKELPSSEVLDALSTIANNPELESSPFDLIRIRIAELLFVCGFRIGEVLTLPANTLVRELVSNEAREIRHDSISGAPVERIGLRYWPEKGGEPIVKWVPTVANDLVLRAIHDIDRVCCEPRKNAQWLEAHPGEVNIALDSERLFSMSELAQLLGLANSGSAMQWVKSKKLSLALTAVRSRALRISGHHIVRALASDRYDTPVLVRDNGTVQTLGSSLFVVFRNEAHTRRASLKFSSVPITWGQISAFLCGRPGVPSIFARFNCSNQDGKPFRIKTHDFRKIVNTVAQRGGLSQIEIARWMGRRRVADNSAYDYRTAAEMAGEMRKLLLRNEVYGVIADQVKTLPESERKVFLESRLAMVHTTPHGQCASNIAENPCATAVSCLGGCRHYMRRKGDEVSRRRLLAIEQDTLVALQRAREARNEGKYNADNWVRAQETVLRTVRAALAIDDDATVQLGALRPVNPDGSALGEPL
ncbi:MAG: hypothetical protein KGN02_05930 [bacterium]|nr:hypothetical protein [bacterium]